ncbi:MAG: kelch repeat-containing protein [Saprospiraceae bacterium]
MSKITFFFLFLILPCSSVYSQAWVEKSSLPAGAPGRHHPVMFTLGDKGYLLTGSDAGTDLNDFYQYDPQTDKWAKQPNFPGDARGYAVGLAAGGMGYIGFGYSANGYLNDLWEFSPQTNQWTAKKSCPCTSREHPALVAAGGKIYVGTGGSQMGNLKDFWAYDIATDNWKKLADLPSQARHHPYYFAIGDSVYVGFGHGSAVVNGVVVYKDFYRYDPPNDAWTRLADFPGEGRVAGTQFSHRGKGYILQGEGDDHDYLGTGEFWEYNPSNDQWKQLPSMPGSGRWAPGNFVIGDSIYLSGGRQQAVSGGFSDLDDLWMYKFVTSSTTGETEWPSGWHAFPNPANGTLQVQYDLSTDLPFQAQLFNLQGQQVWYSTLSGALRLEVPTQHLPAGMYFLKMDFGAKSAVRKVSVQH